MNTFGKIATAVAAAGMITGLATIDSSEDQPTKTVTKIVQKAPERPAAEKPATEKSSESTVEREAAEWRESAPASDSVSSNLPSVEDSVPVEAEKPQKPSRTDYNDNGVNDRDENPNGKIQAEDGSWVSPDFYSRTDYNNNGVTDQNEPGWDSYDTQREAEAAYKAEGEAQYREYCQQNPGDRNCV
jgi:hypothetical protein